MTGGIERVIFFAERNLIVDGIMIYSLSIKRMITVN